MGRRACVSSTRPPHGLLAVITLLVCTSLATGSAPPKLVVVVYPDESDGAPGVIAVNRAIRSTFANEWHGQIDIRNEYVDTGRSGDPEFMHAQVSLLRRKYTGRKVDLVIAGLSSGLDFALKYRAELFPGVPIVFVAVDQREVEARQLPPDVIGVPIRMDLAGTLDLALRLHPDTRRVFVVAGAAPFDAYWEAEARRAFRPHEDRLAFIYLGGLSMTDLVERVVALPPRSIIYYLSIHRDGSGEPVIPAEALERLAARANAPIYSHVDTYVGRGIVGGRVFAFESEGQTAARLGLRILGGENPRSISVAGVSDNADVFDWRQLRHWGIPEESLPPGSVVRYRERTFWDIYKWHVVVGVTICLAEALLIVALLVLRVKRRRADERFRQVVETAPTGMLMVGRDGLIVLVNAQVQRLFGYGREELLGRAVEVLVPERFRGQHPAERDRFFATPVNREMGAGGDLFGRRKDGSEFPVEIALSPIRTPHGLLILTSIIDLTERRRAEDGLRESRRELQFLAGRLLEAQEVERRRIARELHDDLNQSLALLAVEMDILAQTPPAPVSRVTERVHELSARVKELSSSVHALSHQLHPAKLEQMGLVAALRGLCQELTQHHALTVKFTHFGLPDVIPEATALCVYRITQEALRNVAKHSGTDHATVELSGTANGIRLRVSDDGVGFNPAITSGRGGLGLVSMRERLHLVHGELTIDARPSGGTRIEVRIPAPPSNHESGA